METTRAEPDSEPLHPSLEELVASDRGDEQAVLRGILLAGVDQGWFCRPGLEHLLNPPPDQLERLLELTGARPDIDLTEADPWSEAGPPASTIQGEASGWVVLTQRCDLVRAYRREPLVEMARARLLTDPGDARTARLNSPRLVAFADGPAKSAWAADLRQRALIPKNRLLDQPDLVQPIESARRRKQFRLRIGQRYWRDPVPTDLVETLQRPLARVLARSGTRAAFAERFVAFLGVRADAGQVVLAAVRAPESDEQEAEKDWEQILALLQEHEPAAAALLEEHESGVYGLDDVSLGYWLDSFKFDLDEITYGKKASEDQSDPAL
jgi:hypothetical protein